MAYKSARSKATDISTKVKRIVWQRDNKRCIVCGTPYAMPNAHVIPRSKGGLGIEENIVTLCIQCHHNYDQTRERERIDGIVKDYLRNKYPNWDTIQKTFVKWNDRKDL